MCGCNSNCNGITLLRGTGIVSTVDNLDGTFTITYDNGDTFTTSDLTGPQGLQGIQGPAGNDGTNGTNGIDAEPKNRIVANNMSIYTDSGAGVNGVDFILNTADIPVDGDGVHVTYITKQLSGNAGTTSFIITGSGGPLNVFTHTFGGINDETLIVDLYLIRSGIQFKTVTRIYGFETPGSNPIFLTNRTTTINALLNPTFTLSPVLDGGSLTSTIEDVIVTILKQ